MKKAILSLVLSVSALMGFGQVTSSTISGVVKNEKQEVLAGTTGSIVIDVWKDTFANFPPTVADSIAGSEKPTLSSARSNQDLALATWTTSVSIGDIIAFNVDSASTLTNAQLTIFITKT
jgi:hypothetical protein